VGWCKGRLEMLNSPASDGSPSNVADCEGEETNSEHSRPRNTERMDISPVQVLVEYSLREQDSRCFQCYCQYDMVELYQSASASTRGLYDYTRLTGDFCLGDGDVRSGC